MNSPKKDTLKNSLNKPEIFNSCFIEVVNNGRVNALARLIRLFIREQGNFVIPLLFYGGVSSNNFQKQSSEEQLTIYNHPLHAFKLY